MVCQSDWTADKSLESFPKNDKHFLQNLALRIENSTRPEVAHKTVSIQSLESIPKSVSTVSEELVHHEAEVGYVDRVVENYDVATGREAL